MSQHERAKQILTHHRESLDKVSDSLLEYETIDAADIEVIVKGGKIERPLPTARPQSKDDEAARGKRSPGLLPPIATPKNDPEPEPV